VGGIDLSPDLHEDFLSDDLSSPTFRKTSSVSRTVTGLPVLQDRPGADFGPGHYAPVWEQAPAPHDPSIINLDLLSHPSSTRLSRNVGDEATCHVGGY
jgi:hypothetical protein